MPITIDDYVLFCERTIAGLVAAIERLDDAQVVEAPGLPGANTPFAIVTHALGAFEWWTAHVVYGHPSARDRAAELVATGSVTDAIALAAAARGRLRAIAPELAAATELSVAAETSKALGAPWTVGAALMHAYEELAQHLGHLEITVDLLIAAGESPPG